MIWGNRTLVRVPTAWLLVCLSAAVILQGCGRLPGVSGSGADAIEIVAHIVSQGETMFSIADDYYGTTEAASYLADVNGTFADVALEPGALLDVPVGQADIERYRRRTEAKSFYNRGTAFAERGDLIRAAEEFKTALGIDPRFVDAGYNLGVVHLMSGDAQTAAALFDQIIPLRPNDAALHFASGKARYDAGDTQGAIDSFERVLSIEPSHEDARYARAVALYEIGLVEESVLALDLYIRECPDGTWAEEARMRLTDLARGLRAETEPPGGEGR